MVFGIGTDIFKISRFASLRNKKNDPFWKKAFTCRELEKALEFSDPIPYFAAGFAGKEAVYKAISQCGCDFAPGEIEIVRLDSGRPVATLSGATARCVEQYVPYCLSLHLTLSHDTDYASAMAIAEIKITNE